MATSTAWIAAFWALPDFRLFADRNHGETIGVLLAAAIVFGLVSEDIGARMETRWDRKAGAAHRDDWFAYLRQAFRIEPVGHRYMRNLVLRLKFELGMCVGSILGIAGLWWWPATYTLRGVATAVALAVAAYFRWEARTSHKTLSDLRREMLNGVNVVPPESAAFRAAAH